MESVKGDNLGVPSSFHSSAYLMKVTIIVVHFTEVLVETILVYGKVAMNITA